MSVGLMMPSNHLILCFPLLLLPSFFPRIRVFSNESALCIRWPKCWSFSFSINLSKEYLGLMSFRIDWFGLLAVLGTLKSLLHHHSSKAINSLVLSFFTVQLSHLYMTTGETIALTIKTFVGKVMSLLFNMLSRRGKWQTTPVFLPGEFHRQRSLAGSMGSQRATNTIHQVYHSFSPKEQTSFNFMAAVIACSDFGAQGNKICHCFHFSPMYLPWSEGTRCHDLSFLNLGPLISSHAVCGGGLVAQSFLTLYDPMDSSPLGSSVLGISQARILEWWLFPSPGDLPNPGI